MNNDNFIKGLIMTTTRIKQLLAISGKWAIAFLVFAFAMTLNVSEAEGVQIPSNPSEKTSTEKTVSSSTSLAPVIQPISDPVDPAGSAVPEPATLLILSLGLIALQANRLIKIHQE